MSVREWLQRGASADSPIDAFTDFWRGFNNLYGHTHDGAEIERIRAFLRARISSKDAASILASHPKQVAYLLSQPVIDMRGNGRSSAAAITAFHATDDVQTKLCELFAVIYLVRCNLEHGQKSPSTDRDIRLCESSAPLVAAVVACLV